ncbi:EthD domain-containing protein [Sporichthya polymorpha]|uniref:EthD domain-containing protein n=1 Tax=Sporichthya polymorpha TaxID=35751 RepID=UPI0003766AC9|nr:EthD domain-containing protein [Sporichthya polymorpha]
MIKLVFCLRRRESLSHTEFARYWREEHAPLVRAHAETLRIRRYVQSLGVTDPRLAPAVEARWPGGAPFDGVAELWWDSVEDLAAVQADLAGRAAGRALLEDERRFIDLAHSPIFFTEESVVLGDGLSDGESPAG